MWISGDVVFMAAIMLILRGLLRHEERQAEAIDARVAPELAAIREREERLAERLARERGGGGPPERRLRPGRIAPQPAGSPVALRIDVARR